MFNSIDEVIDRFAKLQYITGRTIATVVYLAAEMKKPILVEGPAGVGKTELAKVLAGALGQELIRLQCYEGLDEAKALYEWEYAKQLLYTQILKDKISEVLGSARSLREAVDRIAHEDDVFFSDRFILPRPLLRAISAEKPCVLLIETLDWARALTLLNVQTLDEQLVSETLSTILKYEGDIRKAQQELKDYVEQQRAKLKAPRAQIDKDVLH